MRVVRTRQSRLPACRIIMRRNFFLPLVEGKRHDPDNVGAVTMGSGNNSTAKRRSIHFRLQNAARDRHFYVGLLVHCNIDTSDGHLHIKHTRLNKAGVPCGRTFGIFKGDEPSFIRCHLSKTILPVPRTPSASTTYQ